MIERRSPSAASSSQDATRNRVGNGLAGKHQVGPRQNGVGDNSGKTDEDRRDFGNKGPNRTRGQLKETEMSGSLSLDVFPRLPRVCQPCRSGASKPLRSLGREYMGYKNGLVGMGRDLCAGAVEMVEAMVS
jgi:hypothetical protein